MILFFQNLNDVLNNQNEFWKAENDKLIKENGELQKFFEEIECESHVKGMLVAIQRRFLKLLTEQADYNRSQTFSANQFHRLRSEFSTKSLQWVAERKKLIKIIRNLQISIQVNLPRFYAYNLPKAKLFFVQQLEKKIKKISASRIEFSGNIYDGSNRSD